MKTDEELIARLREKAHSFSGGATPSLLWEAADALEAASQARVVDNTDGQLETVLAAQLQKWMPNHPTREVAVASAWFRAGWKASNDQNAGGS
jgi:hypothetical protein